MEQEISIFIDKQNKTDASAAANTFADESIKNRAYINTLGAEIFTKYLKSENIYLEDLYNMHSIKKVLEEINISDIMLKNCHIDVRVVFDKNIIFVPKSHFEYDILPDVYVVLYIGQESNDAEFLGFFEPDIINKDNCNNDFYFADKTQLKSPYDFIKFLNESSKNKYIELPEDILEDSERIIISMIDNDVNCETKKALIQNLAKSNVLREEFIEYETFENLAYKAACDSELEKGKIKSDTEFHDEFEIFESDTAENDAPIEETEDENKYVDNDECIIQDDEIIDAIQETDTEEISDDDTESEYFEDDSSNEEFVEFEPVEEAKDNDMSSDEEDNNTSEDDVQNEISQEEDIELDDLPTIEDLADEFDNETENDDNENPLFDIDPSKDEPIDDTFGEIFDENVDITGDIDELISAEADSDKSDENIEKLEILDTNIDNIDNIDLENIPNFEADNITVLEEIKFDDNKDIINNIIDEYQSIENIDADIQDILHDDENNPIEELPELSENTEENIENLPELNFNDEILNVDNSELEIKQGNDDFDNDVEIETSEESDTDNDTDTDNYEEIEEIENIVEDSENNTEHEESEFETEQNESDVQKLKVAEAQPVQEEENETQDSYDEKSLDEFYEEKTQEEDIPDKNSINDEISISIEEIDNMFNENEINNEEMTDEELMAKIQDAVDKSEEMSKISDILNKKPIDKKEDKLNILYNGLTSFNKTALNEFSQSESFQKLTSGINKVKDTLKTKRKKVVITTAAVLCTCLITFGAFQFIKPKSDNEALVQNPITDIVPEISDTENINNINLEENKQDIIENNIPDEINNKKDITEKDIKVKATAQTVKELKNDALKSTPATAYLDVKKIVWDVPESLSESPTIQNYLKTAGKSIKVSLSTDLLLATEYAYSNHVKIDLTINKTGGIKASKVISSSGSSEIDNIVLQSVKDTLNAVKLPNNAIIGQDLNLSIIIYF